MEGALSFLDCCSHLTAHDIQIRVVWQFKIIDAGHNTWKIIVRRIGRFARLADHREHRSKCFEPWLEISIVHALQQ